MSALEHVAEDAVVRWCKAVALRQRKLNGLGQRNDPDRMFWIPGGVPFFIEFKRLGEPLRRAQEWKIRKLKELGYDIEVHDDAKEAIKAIRKRVEAARLPKNRRKVPPRKHLRRSIAATGDG